MRSNCVSQEHGFQGASCRLDDISSIHISMHIHADLSPYNICFGYRVDRVKKTCKMVRSSSKGVAKNWLIFEGGGGGCPF